MIFILFVLGLLVGSFLNVVLFRFESGETVVSGRSRCNACRQTIAWYDNIPLLSFIFLRGECRQCGERISWQYPAVEFATAALFALSGARLYVPGNTSSSIELAFALGLIAILTIIFVYDLVHMEIPMAALWAGIFWAILMLFFLWYFSLPREMFFDSRLWDGLIGGGIAFLFFYALVFFSRETWMGMGDAWLALILGLVAGWQLLLPALTLAFGTGAVFGIGLILLGKKQMQSRIPFGPFLVAAVLFIALFGRIIQDVWQFPLWA